MLKSALANDAITAGIGLIDKLFTTDEEKDAAKLRLLELAHKGEIAQMAVNRTEAGHRSLFVAGWRPAVGWTCVAALAQGTIIAPLLEGAATYYAQFSGRVVDLSGLPVLDMTTLSPILMGMLGLGALRTVEKMKRVA